MRVTLYFCLRFCSIGLFSLLLANGLAAEGVISEAINGGTTKGDFDLRYESVKQDNALDDASALTLRSRLSFTTADIDGFSATMEFEDNRIVGGFDEYTVGPTQFNVGEYSVVADPEHTELDQAFFQYKNENVKAKLGRQVITLDNHRYVGHVGWRHDRQTYDALSVDWSPAENLSLKYAYITERNRIFAQAADVNSDDHIFNASYKLAPGTLTAYAYLLSVDSTIDNSLDTLGLSFRGAQALESFKLLYAVELASQTSEAGPTEFEATYSLFEVGAALDIVTVKLGQETLGSDDGGYGFTTPLATLHKFNGWADVFLGTPVQGLVDFYISGSIDLGGGKFSLIYHDFSADESSPTIDDLGSEIDAVYARKLNKHAKFGVKLANYSAGDGASNKVDTDKFWLWVNYSF